MPYERGEFSEPMELDNHFILRLPQEVAEKLRQWIQEAGAAFKDRVSIQLQPDMGHAMVIVDREIFYGKLVDIPYVTEMLKIYEDRKNERSIAAAAISVSSESDTSNESNLQAPTPLPMDLATYKSPGRPSYVDLITLAINSSPEKRMTLAHIYDWMVTNVPEFKDQRHVHSSSGWKNSVRHNLSLHSRFKRVVRFGVEKPSWWTVDITEELRKRDRPKKGTDKQSKSRANTTTPWNRAVQQLRFGRTGGTTKGPLISHSQQPQQQMADQSTALSKSRTAHIDDEAQAMAQTSKTVMAAPVVVGSDGMQWTTLTKMETFNMEATDINHLPQAITVTVLDTNGNGEKPNMALTVTADDESSAPAFCQDAIATNGAVVRGPMMNLVKSIQNSLRESGRQLLTVKTDGGRVQEVTVPIPMPIHVVVKANAECQTDSQPIPSILMPDVLPDTEADTKQYIRLEDCIMGIVNEKRNGSVQTTSNVRAIAPAPQQSLQQLQPMLIAHQHRQSTKAPTRAQRRDQSPAAMSTNEMMQMYFQPNDVQVIQIENQQTSASVPSASTSTATAVNVPMDVLHLRENSDGSVVIIGRRSDEL